MSKNSKSDSHDAEHRRYHHGNLRETLINSGLEVLKNKDSDDFSLREVARNVGVSATSVYRHFSDKQALIDAMCVEGASMLAKLQRDVMKTNGGGQSGLDATGFGYVKFALENPRLFRFMRNERMKYGDPSSPTMKELFVNVATLLPEGATPEQIRIRAFQAWSVVHGVTMLVLEGGMPNDEALIKEVIKTPTI
jgi:AcrR family transcriptional regulator